MASASSQGVNLGDNVEGSAVQVFDIDIGVNPDVTRLDDKVKVKQMDQWASALEVAITQQSILGGSHSMETARVAVSSVQLGLALRKQFKNTSACTSDRLGKIEEKLVAAKRRGGCSQRQGR